MAFKHGIFPISAINGAGPADFGTFNEIITHQSVNQIRDVLPGADASHYLNPIYKGWWTLSALGDLRWHLTYRKGVGDTTIQFPIRTETLVSSDIQHFKNMMYWGMIALDPHFDLRPKPLKLWNTLSGDALPNSYIDYKAMNNMHWIVNGVEHKVREFYVDTNMQYLMLVRLDNQEVYLMMYSATASAAGAGWPEANQVWWMKNNDRANSVKLNGDIGFPDKPPLPTLMVEDDYVVAATRTGQVPEGYYSDGDNHNLKMATLTSVSTGKKWYVGAIGDSSADDKGWGFTRAFLGRMCMVPEPKTWGPISTKNLDEVFEVQDGYTYPLIRRSHENKQVIFNGHTPTKSIKWGNNQNKILNLDGEWEFIPIISVVPEVKTWYDHGHLIQFRMKIKFQDGQTTNINSGSYSSPSNVSDTTIFNVSPDLNQDGIAPHQPGMSHSQLALATDTPGGGTNSLGGALHFNWQTQWGHDPDYRWNGRGFNYSGKGDFYHEDGWTSWIKLGRITLHNPFSWIIDRRPELDNWFKQLGYWKKIGVKTWPIKYSTLYPSIALRCNLGSKDILWMLNIESEVVNRESLDAMHITDDMSLPLKAGVQTLIASNKYKGTHKFHDNTAANIPDVKSRIIVPGQGEVEFKFTFRVTDAAWIDKISVGVKGQPIGAEVTLNWMVPQWDTTYSDDSTAAGFTRLQAIWDWLKSAGAVIEEYDWQ